MQGVRRPRKMAARPSRIGHILTNTDYLRPTMPLTMAPDQKADIRGDANNRFTLEYARATASSCAYAANLILFSLLTCKFSLW